MEGGSHCGLHSEKRLKLKGFAGRVWNQFAIELVMPKEEGWKYEVKAKCLGGGCGAADLAAAAAAAADDDDDDDDDDDSVGFGVDGMNMSVTMRMMMSKRRSISNRNVTSYHNSKDDIDDEHEIPELKEGDNTLLTWIERQDNTKFLQIHLLGMAKNHTCSSNASNTAVCFSSCKLSMQSTEPPSGYINATEFIAPLSRWVHDSKTAPRFIKYNLQPLVVKMVERNMKKQCLVPRHVELVQLGIFCYCTSF